METNNILSVIDAHELMERYLPPLIERNRRPTSRPSQTEVESSTTPTLPPMQLTVECPISPEQAEMLIEAADMILAELRAMNMTLASLPTKDDALAVQATLEKMLAAMQPSTKPAGRKSVKHSSRIGSLVRKWLRALWYRLPTPSWEWLVVVPLGAAAYLAWYCVNLLVNGIAQILP